MHQFITPGLYWAVVDAQKRTLADPGGVEGPLLFLVPEADEVVDPETTLRFVERAGRAEIEACRLEGLRHEPHNEPEREKVFALAATWLDANFPSAGGS